MLINQVKIIKKGVLFAILLLSVLFPLFSQDSITVLENGNVGIGTDTPTEMLEIDGNQKVNGNSEITGDVTVGGDISFTDQSSVGNLHLFLADQCVPLWQNSSGGPYIQDVAAYVPAEARGAILKVIVRVDPPETSGSIIFADRTGNFGNELHYFLNGFTNYNEKWAGGMVIVPFYEGKKFKWKMVSNESGSVGNGNSSSRVFSYGAIIGWF